MNKHKLGISIYPEHQTHEEVIEYIDKAHKLGYSRIFASLLQIEDETQDEMISKLKKIFNHCNKLNYEVVLDVAPSVLKKLNIILPDVTFFEDLGVTTIRFDEGYDNKMELDITRISKINVELNISIFKDITDEIVQNNIPVDRIIGSHNFYPQKFTGLDYDYFIEMSKYFKNRGLRTSAFVASQDPNATMGPWPGNDTLCTLEMHRNLPILVQGQHLLLSGLIDDISIGNANASYEELFSLSTIDSEVVQIEVNIESNVSDIEHKILFEFKDHFRRGDLTSYFIRSTMSRVEYKDESIKQRIDDKPQLPGEIYILNDEFGRYKGELHIILKEMPYDPKKNYVGIVKESNNILLKHIGSWKKIKLLK